LRYKHFSGFQWKSWKRRNDDEFLQWCRLMICLIFTKKWRRRNGPSNAVKDEWCEKYLNLYEIKKIIFYFLKVFLKNPHRFIIKVVDFGFIKGKKILLISKFWINLRNNYLQSVVILNQKSKSLIFK
jgi:hypothetical protein